MEIGFTIAAPIVMSSPAVFQTDIYNSEGGYNTKTGKFVCRNPGIHVFILTITASSVVDGHAGCYIYVNDEQKTYVYAFNLNMSLVMRKPAFCICENKDADQLCGNRTADQRLCFRYTDSTIPLLSKSEI